MTCSVFPVLQKKKSRRQQDIEIPAGGGFAGSTRCWIEWPQMSKSYAMGALVRLCVPERRRGALCSPSRVRGGSIAVRSIRIEMVRSRAAVFRFGSRAGGPRELRARVPYAPVSVATSQMGGVLRRAATQNPPR
jgi:hypothetical protein